MIERLVLAIALLATPCFGEIALDASSVVNRTGTNDPETWTHTTTGDPVAVVVFVSYADAGPLINAGTSTYGGVTLETFDSIRDITGESVRTDVLFADEILHSVSIPSGNQTVSVDFTSATGVDMLLTAFTFTTSGADPGLTQYVFTGCSVGADTADPQCTVDPTGRTVSMVGSIGSGLNTPASLTPLSGTTGVGSQDFGTKSAVSSSLDAVRSTSFSYGFTAASDDVALYVVAVTDDVVSAVKPRIRTW